MNEIDFLNELNSLINRGVDAFHIEEAKVISKTSSHLMDYRKANERPIAAFMTEYLFDHFKPKINPIAMHELPLKGVLASTVKEIKDDILKYKSSWNPATAYSNFNIDGFISFVDVNTFDTFFEYKSEKMFDEMKMMTDYAKFLIYTAGSPAVSYFVYISFQKDPSLTKSFIKRTGAFSKIDYKSVASSNSVYHYAIKEMTSSLNISQIKDLAKKVITLDYANEVLKNIPAATGIINFNDKIFYKKRNIYGTNVLLSYKARFNARKIKECASLVTSSEGYVGQQYTDVMYNEIAGYMKTLKKFKVGENKNTNASKRLVHQGTNWLLATIEIGLKEFWPDYQTTFDIRDVTREGKAVGPIPGDYPLMKRAIQAKYAYGLTKSQSEEFSGGDFENISEYMTKNNLETISHTRNEFKVMLTRILYHMKDIYIKILDFESEKDMVPFNENYEKFLNKSGRISMFEKINSSLQLRDRKLLKLDFNTDYDSLRANMKEIISEIIAELELHEDRENE